MAKLPSQAKVELSPEAISFYFEHLGFTKLGITTCPDTTKKNIQHGEKQQLSAEGNSKNKQQYQLKGGAPKKLEQLQLNRLSRYILGCISLNPIDLPIEEQLNIEPEPIYNPPTTELIELTQDQLIIPELPKDLDHIYTLKELLDKHKDVATLILEHVYKTNKKSLQHLSLTCSTINKIVLTELEHKSKNELCMPEVHKVFMDIIQELLIQEIKYEEENRNEKFDSRYIIIRLYPSEHSIKIRTYKFGHYQIVNLSNGYTENKEILISPHDRVHVTENENKILQKIGQETKYDLISKYINTYFTDEDLKSIYFKTYRLQKDDTDKYFSFIKNKKNPIANGVYHKIINDLANPNMEAMEKVHQQYTLFNNICKEKTDIEKKYQKEKVNRINRSNLFSDDKFKFYIDLINNDLPGENKDKYIQEFQIYVIENFKGTKDILNKILKYFEWMIVHIIKENNLDPNSNIDNLKRILEKIKDHHKTTQFTLNETFGGAKKTKQFTRTNKKIKWPLRNSKTYCVRLRSIWINSKNIEYVKVKNTNDVYIFKKIL